MPHSQAKRILIFLVYSIDLLFSMDCKVHLYIVCNTKSSTDFKIEAIFDNSLKLGFTCETIFGSKDYVGPYIYTLQYQVQRQEDDTLKIQHENRWKPVKWYQLRILYRRQQVSYSMSRNLVYTDIPSTFMESKKRPVEWNSSSVWHYTLIDLEADKVQEAGVPGES